MTFYEVFYNFWTSFFPSPMVTTYEQFFVLLSMISVFALLRYLLKLIQKALGVFIK